MCGSRNLYKRILRQTFLTNRHVAAKASYRRKPKWSRQLVEGSAVSRECLRRLMCCLTVARRGTLSNATMWAVPLTARHRRTGALRLPLK